MLPLLDDSFLVVSYLDKGIYVDGWRLGIAPEPNRECKQHGEDHSADHWFTLLAYDDGNFAAVRD